MRDVTGTSVTIERGECAAVGVTTIENRYSGHTARQTPPGSIAADISVKRVEFPSRADVSADFVVRPELRAI
jgi:hypothetical protein